jgi:hypothetical protein
MDDRHARVVSHWRPWPATVPVGGRRWGNKAFAVQAAARRPVGAALEIGHVMQLVRQWAAPILIGFVIGFLGLMLGQLAPGLAAP